VNFTGQLDESRPCDPGHDLAGVLETDVDVIAAMDD